MMKRILSLMLALVLCVGLLPVQALAAFTQTPANVTGVSTTTVPSGGNLTVDFTWVPSCDQEWDAFEKFEVKVTSIEASVTGTLCVITDLNESGSYTAEGVLTDYPAGDYSVSVVVVYTGDVCNYEGSSKSVTVTAVDSGSGDSDTDDEKKPCTQNEGCELTEGHDGECRLPACVCSEACTKGNEYGCKHCKAGRTCDLDVCVCTDVCTKTNNDGCKYCKAGKTCKLATPPEGGDDGSGGSDGDGKVCICTTQCGAERNTDCEICASEGDCSPSSGSVPVTVSNVVCSADKIVNWDSMTVTAEFSSMENISKITYDLITADGTVAAHEDVTEKEEFSSEHLFFVMLEDTADFNTEYYFKVTVTDTNGKTSFDTSSSFRIYPTAWVSSFSITAGQNAFEPFTIQAATDNSNSHPETVTFKIVKDGFLVHSCTKAYNTCDDFTPEASGTYSCTVLWTESGVTSDYTSTFTVGEYKNPEYNESANCRATGIYFLNGNATNTNASSRLDLSKSYAPNSTVRMMVDLEGNTGNLQSVTYKLVNETTKQVVKAGSWSSGSGTPYGQATLEQEGIYHCEATVYDKNGMITPIVGTEKLTIAAPKPLKLTSLTADKTTANTKDDITFTVGTEGDGQLKMFAYQFVAGTYDSVEEIDEAGIAPVYSIFSYDVELSSIYPSYKFNAETANIVTAGEYTCVAMLMDEAGNQTFAFRSFTLTDSGESEPGEEKAKVTLSVPATANVMEVVEFKAALENCTQEDVKNVAFTISAEGNSAVSRTEDCGKELSCNFTFPNAGTFNVDVKVELNDGTILQNETSGRITIDKGSYEGSALSIPAKVFTLANTTFTTTVKGIAVKNAHYVVSVGENQKTVAATVKMVNGAYVATGSYVFPAAGAYKVDAFVNGAYVGSQEVAVEDLTCTINSVKADWTYGDEEVTLSANVATNGTVSKLEFLVTKVFADGTRGTTQTIAGDAATMKAIFAPDENIRYAYQAKVTLQEKQDKPVVSQEKTFDYSKFKYVYVGTDREQYGAGDTIKISHDSFPKDCTLTYRMYDDTDDTLVGGPWYKAEDIVLPAAAGEYKIDIDVERVYGDKTLSVATGAGFFNVVEGAYITGITASPANPAAGQTVTFTVTTAGQGDIGEIKIYLVKYNSENYEEEQVLVAEGSGTTLTWTAVKADSPYKYYAVAETENALGYYSYAAMDDDLTVGDPLPVTPTVPSGGADSAEEERPTTNVGSVWTPKQEETIAVPVTGDEKTNHVQATVKDSTATVKDINKNQIEQVVSNKEGDGIISLDVSNAKQDIDRVNLPVSSVKEIVKAAEKAENENAAFEVTFKQGSVKLDTKSMESISDQARGANLQIILEQKEAADLSQAQQSVVAEMEVYGTVSAALMCVETKTQITDLNGGKATLSVPFELPQDKVDNGFVVWGIDKDGNKIQCRTWIEDGKLFWEAEAMTDFVIAYDENAALGLLSYTVRKGDTLAKIADENGSTVEELMQLNADLIRDPTKIYETWELKLPKL